MSYKLEDNKYTTAEYNNMYCDFVLRNVFDEIGLDISDDDYVDRFISYYKDQSPWTRRFVLKYLLEVINGVSGDFSEAERMRFREVFEWIMER